MKPKTLGYISLITTVLVTLWIAVLIVDKATAGPMETFEQTLAVVSQQRWTFTFNYANAVLFTIAATILMTGLYLYCKDAAPSWCFIGLVFIPVYSVLNLSMYLSQVTIVPSLLALYQTLEYESTAELLLRLTIHEWSGSAVSILNALAYAVLGIPSVIYGVILLKRGILMRVSAVLLILSAVADVVGLLGVIVGSPLLSIGTLLGGVIFVVLMYPLTVGLLRLKEED